jgi:hypothetical protein
MDTGIECMPGGFIGCTTAALLRTAGASKSSRRQQTAGQHRRVNTRQQCQVTLQTTHLHGDGN